MKYLALISSTLRHKDQTKSGNVLYIQGDQIGRNLAKFGLLFKGPGYVWVIIWFVVGTYRVQKGVL